MFLKRFIKVIHNCVLRAVQNKLYMGVIGTHFC